MDFLRTLKASFQRHFSRAASAVVFYSLLFDVFAILGGGGAFLLWSRKAAVAFLAFAFTAWVIWAAWDVAKALLLTTWDVAFALIRGNGKTL